MAGFRVKCTLYTLGRDYALFSAEQTSYS